MSTGAYIWHKFDIYYVLPRTSEIITARKRSLGQGNVFAPVCHSIDGRGALHPGREVCIQGKSASRAGWVDPPPHRILHDTVNERVVLILLECILVEVRIIAP